MCVAAQVANDVRGKKPSLWVISRQEFDRAEPVPLILPVWLQIPAVRSQGRQTSNSGSLRQNSRYKNGTTTKMRLSVSSCSLQGIAERPLPCEYNVIQRCQRPFTAVTRVQIPSGDRKNAV